MKKIFDYEADDLILASSNARVQNAKKSQKFYLNAKYRESKNILSFLFRVNCQYAKPYAGPVKVEYTIHSPCDFDNVLKVINDSLQAGGVITSDSNKNIKKFSGTIEPRRRGQLDYLRVKVWSLG